MNLDFIPERNNTSEGDDLSELLQWIRYHLLSWCYLSSVQDALAAVVEIYEDLGLEIVYQKKEDFEGL